MSRKDESVRMHIIPGDRGLDVAMRRLKSLGIEGIEPSRDGKRLRVVVPRKIIERLLNLRLTRKKRKIQFGPIQRTETEFQWPKKGKVPKALRDVVGKVVFPKRPDFH